MRNVARRWKSELDTDKKVYVLSPYITSKAEDILANAKNCEIYTDISVENFVFGSSSLKTLKNLINKGIKVYHLPKLHAKIILVADTFVSIGSQNLTNKGTKNKEATFTSSFPETIKPIEKELKEKWLPNREEVNIENLIDIEEVIEPFDKKLKGFNNDILKAKNEVEKRGKRRKDKENEYREKLKFLEIILNSLLKTKQKVNGTVKAFKKNNKKSEDYFFDLIPIFDFLKFDDNFNWTFLPDSIKDNNLLSWQIENKPVYLNKNFQYLAIIENTGKVGWVRVMKTKLTYYAQFLLLNGFIKVNGDSHDLRLEANWDSSTLPEYNLVANFHKIGCEVYMWFDIKGLEIREILSDTDADNSDLEDWITDNENLFKKKLIEKSLLPFQFKRNLQGPQADAFLGKNAKYSLKLGKYNNYPWLCCINQ